MAARSMQSAPGIAGPGLVYGAVGANSQPDARLERAAAWGLAEGASLEVAAHELVQEPFGPAGNEVLDEAPRQRDSLA